MRRVCFLFVFLCASCHDFESPSSAKSGTQHHPALACFESVLTYRWMKFDSTIFDNMGTKKKQLSQAEVWDDSALVQSWNDALEEYKVSEDNLEE